MATHTFRIQLTRGDYLRYFVRHHFLDLWTPWVVSLALAGVATLLLREAFRTWWVAGLVFLAVFVGTLLAMLALSTLLFALKLRGMKSDGSVLEPKTITVGAEGLDIAGSASAAHYDWSQVSALRRSGRFAFVDLTGAHLMLFWPLRDTPEEALDAIEGFLAGPSTQAVA